MLIASMHIEDIAHFKSKLNASFDMKDLGNANYILGMHIVQNKEKKVLFLSQPKYIGKVFMHFNMEGGKVRSNSLPSYVKLSPSDCPKSNVKRAIMAKMPFCFVIVSLMYAMTCTRPDIVYAVGLVGS